VPSDVRELIREISLTNLSDGVVWLTLAVSQTLTPLWCTKGAAGLVCANSKELTFDELRLPDEMTMIHIPRFRRVVCSKCRSRKVSIRSVWPKRDSGGPFYSPSMSGK
jgi:hypothetical protein